MEGMVWYGGRAMGVRLLGTIHLEIVEIGSCNYWEIIDGV